MNKAQETFYELETAFDQDLNDDGDIGEPSINSGQSIFSIKGTAEVGNTLSISEDAADPDGVETLSYSWETSSDGNTWNEVSTAATYLVETTEEGKSIRAKISYRDGEGFDEVVTTSSTGIPFINSGQSIFSIKGTAEVGNTLSISEDAADPDGVGTLSYSWETSSDGNTWNEVSTAATYLVETTEEGKSIRAKISYRDGEGFDEVVTTSSTGIPSINSGQSIFSIKGTAEVGNTLFSEDAADPDGVGTLSYRWETSSDGNTWNEVSTAATYLVETTEEGKSIRAKISYRDGEGFDEVVTTSSVPSIDDGY